MKITSKTLLIAFVIAAIAVPLLLYQPVLANDAEEFEVDDIEVDDIEVDDVPVVKPGCRPGWRKKGRLVWFLKNAEKTEVTGEVVALERNILVLDVGESAVNILVAPKWTDMEDVLESEELFGDLDDTDETITMKALMVGYENSKGVTVNVIFGYEAEADGEHYYAVLPFNIEVD